MSYVRNPYRPLTGFEAFIARSPIYSSNPYRLPLVRNPNRLWTLEEDGRLRLLAAIGTRTPDIAWQLGRSIEAVYSRARFLGVSLMPPDPPLWNTYPWS